MTIHVLKTYNGPGKSAETRCRMTGKQVVGDPYLFTDSKGSRFKAVLPSDPTLGPTCKDCKRTDVAKRTDKTNMRLL